MHELHPISWTLKLRFEKREASEMPRRKKARYGREMRARAADLFEAGLGFELAAKKLDVPAPAVRKWLYAYRATGRKGLIGMGESRRTYDMETKLAVARAVVDEGMPRSEAMARFGIAAATSLDRWCRLYREGGPEALEPGRRGRPEGPGGRTRERELEERVRKLEAQVAYLKKSIALKAEKSSRTGRSPGRSLPFRAPPPMRPARGRAARAVELPLCRGAPAESDPARAPGGRARDLLEDGERVRPPPDSDVPEGRAGREDSGQDGPQDDAGARHPLRHPPGDRLPSLQLLPRPGRREIRQPDSA